MNHTAILTHYNHYGKLEKEGNYYHSIQRPKIHSKIEENACNLIHAGRNKKTVILMAPPSVKGGRYIVFLVAD